MPTSTYTTKPATFTFSFLNPFAENKHTPSGLFWQKDELMSMPRAEVLWKDIQTGKWNDPVQLIAWG